MATVTRENISTLHDKLTVTVSSTDYLETYNNALKNYAKQANIPGFRKGMVPAGMVKKMYGQSVFTDEVLKAVEKSLFDYLDKEKLEIFAQPMPADENDAAKLDQNNAKDYSFGFEIGLKPVFEIPALNAAKLTRHKVTITDQMAQDELSNLKRKHGKMSEPKTADNDETILNVTFTPTNEAGEIAEGAEAKDNSLLIKYFTPAYQAKLKGTKAGDSFTFKLSEALAEKELEYVMQDLKLEKGAEDSSYKMDIVKLGYVTPAELDEAFFLAAFPNQEIATEADAITALKTDIEKYWDNQTLNQLQDGVYHYLVDNTPMEFPTNFLKKWMQTGRDKQYTAEEVETEYPSFTSSLKWTLISDSINKTNDFKVEKDEIKAFAKNQIMGYMGMSVLDDSNMSWIDGYADKMMSDKKFIEDTYHRVQTEKLFTWATEQVSVTEKPISVEDFTKLVTEHKH